MSAGSPDEAQHAPVANSVLQHISLREVLILLNGFGSAHKSKLKILAAATASRKCCPANAGHFVVLDVLVDMMH